MTIHDWIKWVNIVTLVTFFVSITVGATALQEIREGVRAYHNHLRVLDEHMDDSFFILETICSRDSDQCLEEFDNYLRILDLKIAKA